MVRLLLWTGVPLFDLVRLLGEVTLGVGTERAAPAWQSWQSWPVGLLLHASVGAIWAIFYAYFFWATYRWKPRVQGLVFSLGPAVLAGLVMVPQLAWMRPGTAGEPADLQGIGIFAWRLGWGGPVGILFGHLVYGAVMGALYCKPVGQSPAREARRPLRAGGVHRAPGHSAGPGHGESSGDGQAAGQADGGFMFATGIECSYPTIDGGRWRMDQLDETDHYRYWRRDLELVRELGLRYLRYGPPLHRMHLGPGRYDWSFMDAVAGAMRELGIEPIMDLCHFGLPQWLGDFQNPDFPQCFADYTDAFARRYPWVRLYTPVNEMYVTARMSALDGVWNEQRRDERAFVTATKHLAKASALAMQAILRQRPDAVFVNSESSEFFQACCPDEKVIDKADFENERRFIALDLLYGVESKPAVRQYLFDQGLSAEEHRWFMSQQLADRCILGIDYYEWNEKLINADGGIESLGELFGWYVVTKQYYDRYHRPLMHTETNCQDAKAAPDWRWRQWHNVQLMRRSGVPVIGFTWYSLIDQVDWNVGLSRSIGNVNPVGLYDLNRDQRPVAQAYAQLLDLFGREPLLADRKAADLADVLELLRV